MAKAQKRQRFNARTDAKRTATAKRQTMERKHARGAKYANGRSA